MIETLKVTPSELEKAASSFEGTGNEVQSLTTQMLELISGISDGVWSGEAANTYKAKFAGLQDDILRLNKMITEHAEDLRNIAAKYTDTESQIQDLVNSLKDDIIS